MATDTKNRSGMSQGEVDSKFDEITSTLDPKKKEQQQRDREYVVEQLGAKAGERVRKLALNIKASPELRKEIEDLAQDLEESVPRLSTKAKTEDALITQIESAVDKAEKYILSAANEEEKREKKEEEKRKEKENKVHPHAPEKPESADKTPEEKAKAGLEEIKKGLHSEENNKQEPSTAEVVATAAIAGASAGATVDALGNQKKTAEQDASHEETKEQSSKNRNLSLEERTALRQKELREEVRQRKQEELAKEQAQPTTPQQEQPKRRMSSSDKAMARPFSTGGAVQRRIPGDQGATAQNFPKYVPPKGQIKIPALNVSSSPLAGKIKMGSMTRRIGFTPGVITETNTITMTEEGDIIEEYDEYGINPEQNDRGKNVQGNFRDSDSHPGSQHTQAGAGGEGGGSGDGGGGNNRIKRGGLGVPGPHLPNPITRGGLGVPQISKLTQGGTSGLAKEGLKVALKHPYVRGAIAILLLVFLLIVVLIIVISGGGGGGGTGSCQGAPAPAATEQMLQPQVTGPATAAAGETVPYQIAIADTQPSQEITVVATIPQGMSTNQADITSSWTRFVVTGNTITWKATENLPPNSLSPANFNFTVSLKAAEQVPNAALTVTATPTRAAAAPNPGTPGGPAPAPGKEKSTEELKSIYGASPQEVEAQLVAIDFQGKQVKVHKKVQGLFEKVNREITAANTGYKFRLVGTYNWRQKNCPGGCSGLSTHSFGTTMDINWDTNPYTTANTHDLPPAVVDIFKNNGFEWGGDWSGSKDWMHFQYNGEPGIVGSVGGNCTPAGGAVSADYVPPSINSCQKYEANMRKNPIQKNFGDPTCNFNKDALLNLLKTEDPPNADFWFNEVIRCESAYNPNAWASPNTGTPDPGGAWGLYQMGSSTPGQPGQPPPAEGRGGPNDRGDVPWVLQTKNAVSKGKQLGGTRTSLARYWACAR